MDGFAYSVENKRVLLYAIPFCFFRTDALRYLKSSFDSIFCNTKFFGAEA